MITTQTQVIDLADLAAVRESVDKANRKAVKIGVPGYVLVEGERGSRDVTAPDPFNPGSWKVVGQVTTVEVSVLGEAPKYAGWTFVATLDWVGDEAVIRKVRGLDEVDTTAAREGLVPNGCDHCNTARDRNETYLLHHEDGSFKQVGSTCLREFLGVTVNLSLIGYNPYEGCDSTNRYAPDTYSTLRALEDTLAIVRAYGWTSAGAAYADPSLTSTKSRLVTAYEESAETRNGRETAGAEFRRAIREHAHEDDAETAAAILAWVRNTLPGNSEYAQNLKAAVGAAPQVSTVTDIVTGEVRSFEVEQFQARHLGVVISAVTGYQRWTEKETARKAERTSLANSTYVGEVKARLRDLHLEVRSARWITTDFGSSLLVLLSDEAGNAYKTFASNPHRALEIVGAKVVLDGTVKKHEEYNGLRSTVLTRCSVKEVVPA